MLRIEEVEGWESLNVISDDANAENAALDEAIMDAAPHLHADFVALELTDKGLLVWRVERSEYDSLLEVLDALDGVNPDDIENAMEIVEQKRKEVVE